MKTYVLILLLLVTLGHSAVSGPAIQISHYDVVPENVYPGTTGQLEVALLNSGSETARSTTIYYNYGLEQNWNIYLGDIGAGSEAITTIPFRVPEKTDSGIFIINIDIYYLSEDGAGSKHSMSNIPITISQHEVLEVKTLSLSKEAIGKGEKVTAELEIMNTGGIMKNVVISTMDNSSFSLDGTTQQRVGDITANTSKIVSVSLISSSSAEEGTYTIPLEITYNDALQNEISQTANIGPVMVTESSSLFRISCEAISESEIGSELAYNITLENKGGSVRSATLMINENEVFTPIGPNVLYFDDLQPDEKRSEVVHLGVDASSSSGYYTLPMTIKTDGAEVEYNIGIFVQATPAVILTSETESTETGTQTTIRIANSGNTVIRSLYVYAEPPAGLDIIGPNEKFIGTLNVDDFASFQVTTRAKQNGPDSIPVVIQFKDNDNVEHTIRKEVTVQMASNMSSVASQRPSGYPGTQHIQSTLLYLGGGLLLAGVAYFGYKRWKGGQK